MRSLLLKWLVLLLSASLLLFFIFRLRPAKAVLIRTEADFPQTEAAFFLNTADAEALEALPGIGEKLAGRILLYREEHGGFDSVDELIFVDGIGEKTLNSIIVYLSVEKGQ